MLWAVAATMSGQSLPDSIVKYQMADGGWPKNQNWAEGVDITSDPYLSQCYATGIGSTIDNGATWKEMRVLAAAYAENGNSLYRDSFIKALDYLFRAQYANGGWPQFYPSRGENHYSNHITFNDNAMTGVMRIMRDVAWQRGDFSSLSLPQDIIDKARMAYDKGVECILKCQIRKDGKLTVWCQQHDETTLLPAGARAYELASFCGTFETCDIIRLLMEDPHPTQKMKESIMAAVQWLDAHTLYDIAVEDCIGDNGKHDRRVVHSPGNRLWARYYDLINEKPMFVGRDGIPHLHLSDIEQ